MTTRCGGSLSFSIQLVTILDSGVAAEYRKTCRHMVLPSMLRECNVKYYRMRPCYGKQGDIRTRTDNFISLRTSLLTNHTYLAASLAVQMPQPLRLNAVALISPQNHPILIRTFQKGDELKYHYVAHTSLDVIEERS